MKITIASIVLFFAFAFSCAAQSAYRIKGVVIDTVDNTKIRATITVLNAKDSILVKFTHSNADGTFTIENLPAGKFSLWVTHPDYADQTENFTLDAANPTHDFGNINLLLRQRVLQEVKIKGAPIELKIKGDTSEFNARAYVIQPNDKVEDLLKQVQGMTVDKDGKITFRGEKIDKALVDGEEFFGDDPLLVTRNLRADMVDKLQVYDRKSDQATVTGIDDGVKIKTLNVKLKEDKKNGAFGKVSAGVGSSGLYNGQAMANKFKGNYKLSVFGTTANNGINGLGYEDEERLGTGSSTLVEFDDGDSGYYNEYDEIDASWYSGQGFPSARTGGAHFDTKWNEKKQSINTNYKIGVLALTNNINSVSQQNLPATNVIPADNVINRSSDENTYNHTFRQRADVTFQSNPNPNSSLKIAVDGTLRDLENNSNSFSLLENGAGSLLTREMRTQSGRSRQKAFNASFLYSKKFKKADRVFSWNVSESYTESNGTIKLYSEIYSPANTPTTTIIDQYKPTVTNNSTLNSNITFNEPLTKTLSLGMNYGLGFNNSSANRESFNKSADGNYDEFDAIFSNNYKFNQLTNQLGAIFSYKSADTKTTLTFGTRASNVNFKQVDQYTGNVYKRSFINWSPRTRFQHKMAPSEYITIQYNGSNSQPMMEQIQPVRINNNPLNITIGNPDLGPSFNHNMSATYNISQEISGRSLYISGSYGFVMNQIISKVDIDNTGRTVTQYQNLNDKTPMNYSLYAQISRKIGIVNTGLTLRTNANINYAYTNGVLNQSKTTTYNADARIGIYKEKKYSFTIQGGPSYTFNTQSVNSLSSYNSLGVRGYGYLTVYLPGKIILGSDIDYLYQAAIQDAPPVNMPILSANLSKAFLKEQNLKLSITGNNLFNRNQNYRNITATGFSQTNYASIRRYFMVTLSWDFTKFGTDTNDAN